MICSKARGNPESLDSYGPEPPEPTEEELMAVTEDDGKVKGHWNKRLSSFQKLLVVKVFLETKVSPECN